MRLSMIKKYDNQLYTYSILNKNNDTILELNFGKMQHFGISIQQFSHLMFSIHLIFISIYIMIPFINLKPNTRYGFMFDDTLRKSWISDKLTLYFMQYSYVIKFPWQLRYYSTTYENRISDTLHIKGISKKKTKNGFNYNAIIEDRFNRVMNVEYCKKNDTYRHRIFRRFISNNELRKHYLVIIDKSTNKVFREIEIQNIDCHMALIDFCNENNYNLIKSY